MDICEVRNLENKPIPHTDFVMLYLSLKISPFNSPYLTQNNHSKYILKDHLVKQACQINDVTWGLENKKYTAREKIGVKVDWFLKIVWKISNLDKSIRLICKIRNFLTIGFEIYAI